MAITDAAGFKTTLAKLGPSLAGTTGRLLVDADDPSVVAGTSPFRLAIVLFDDATSAHNWQSSPAFKTFSDELIKEGTVQISVAGGIADPGAPLAVPAASLGPTGLGGKGNDRFRQCRRSTTSARIVEPRYPQDGGTRRAF